MVSPWVSSSLKLIILLLIILQLIFILTGSVMLNCWFLVLERGHGCCLPLLIEIIVWESGYCLRLLRVVTLNNFEFNLVVVDWSSLHWWLILVGGSLIFLSSSESTSLFQSFLGALALYIALLISLFILIVYLFNFLSLLLSRWWQLLDNISLWIGQLAWAQWVLWLRRVAPVDCRRPRRFINLHLVHGFLILLDIISGFFVPLVIDSESEIGRQG